MKEGIHPDYREVLFHDMSNDFKFITRSTIGTRETGEFEGKQYPLVKIEVSSESHPFYTGKHKIVDTAGRVEKFRQKFGSVGSKTAGLLKKPAKKYPPPTTASARPRPPQPAHHPTRSTEQEQQDLDEASPSSRRRDQCASAHGPACARPPLHPAGPDRPRSLEERGRHHLWRHVDHGPRHPHRLAHPQRGRPAAAGRKPAGLLVWCNLHQTLRLAAGRPAGRAHLGHRLLPGGFALDLVHHLPAGPPRRSAAPEAGLRRPARTQGLRPHPGRWRLPDLSRFPRPAAAQPRDQPQDPADRPGGLCHVRRGPGIRCRQTAPWPLAGRSAGHAGTDLWLAPAGRRIDRPGAAGRAAQGWPGAGPAAVAVAATGPAHERRVGDLLAPADPD
ncbi:hypothetical protein Lal_00006984 [Lupinus albus]|nr:hypothetical protein Lal_00006984 [Lupinus albus]